MRCGTSFFNAAVWKNCLKRYWPVWAALLLSLILSLVLPVMNADDPGEAAEILRQLGGYGGTVTCFIFSCIAAMTVFGWMYQPKSAGFTGALPLKREAMYLSCALAGFAMLAFPAAVTALLCCVAAAGSCGFAIAAAVSFGWLGRFLLLSLCFFGFACLCAQLTGTLWVLPVVYSLLNVAVVSFWFLISNVLNLLLPGFGGGVPQIAANLSPLVRMFLYEWGDPYFRCWGLGAYALFGVVCAFLALLLAKKRRLETATDTVALEWLKPVFRWIFASGFALCFANLIYLILMSEERYHYVFMAAFLAVGGLLGWLIAEMLVRKSFKVGSCLKTFPILAVLLVLLVVFCAVGGLGYSAYCPEAEDVETAVLSVPGQSCSTDDPGEIRAIQAIHRDLADNPAPGGSYDSIQVVYRMKNGGTVARSFSGEDLSEEGKQACRDLFQRQLRSGYEKILTESGLLLNTGVDYCHEGGSAADSSWIYFELEDEESRDLLRRGILMDADAGTLTLSNGWFLGESTQEPGDEYYSLSLRTWRKHASEEPKGPGAWYDPFDGAYYGITVTPAAGNTWAILEQYREKQGEPNAWEMREPVE